VVVIEIGNFRRIGFALAHPDPDVAMTLDHRIAAHAETRWHAILAGNGDTSARRIEGEAVVAALQPIADHLALVQRRAAMAAAIFERNGRAVLAAEKHDRLAEQHAAERRTADLACFGGDVPAILEEHGATPNTRAEL